MVVRILLVALLSLFLRPVAIRAQSVGVLKGIVSALSTREPLPGATISLIGNGSIGAATGPDGSFSITLSPGSHRFYCTYVGFTTDTFTAVVTADSVTEVNIGLQASAGMLKTIVVSSGKFGQRLEELTMSMEVLKPSLINNKNTMSIETALEQTPGVTIIDNDPQIRGGSGFTFGVGSRVAIVVDGIPLLSGDAGRAEWNYIPVENIEQVEVIKGSSSVLYGSSALNGVINIRSAYPRAKPKTTVSYSVGGYSAPVSPAQNWYGASLPGYMNLNFMHSEIVRKNMDVVIGGNFNADQGYIGPAPAMGYMDPDLKKAFLLTDSIPTYTNKDMLRLRGRVNVNIKYRSKKIPGLSYGANSNGMLNKTNMQLAWLNDSAGLYKGYPGAVFLEDQTLFNIDPFVKYDNATGTSHSLVTRLFYNDNKITNNQSTQGQLYYGEYQAQHKFKPQGLTTTGGIVGSLASTHARLYDSSGTPENRVANIAMYLQLDKKLWKVVNLQCGIRYEYFRVNNLEPTTKPVFRGGVSVQALRGTWLRASYGDGLRYPTIAERYIATKAGLFGVFPNPGLKPEVSQSFEAGVKQGFKIGDCMGYLDIAAFRQNYQNTIEYLFGVWNPKVAIVGFKFVNTGESRVDGLDLSLACATPEKNKEFGLTALAGYTYINPVSLTPNLVYATSQSLQGGPGLPATFKNSSMDTTGNMLKYRFRHMVKADVEVRIYRLGLGVSYRYYSKMQNIDKAFGDIEELTQSVPGMAPIVVVDYWKAHDGFHIFDARASYKLSPEHKISVVCNNLFNTAYYLRPLKIEPPRNVAFQYNYTF